ncbi:MAG: hypothetical protein HC820_02715 [Hydrococcus sp. RM1_1_31]|nr:hypothetical protein [Hydrococcus sp. RM1_1_31]
MFEDIVSWLRSQPKGEEAFARGKSFVIQNQKKMWIGLMQGLQEYNRVCST